MLDLTDTGFPLDKIWAALKYGGLQIEKLCLGGCNVGKKPADCAQVNELSFSATFCLQRTFLVGEGVFLNGSEFVAYQLCEYLVAS